MSPSGAGGACCRHPLKETNQIPVSSTSLSGIVKEYRRYVLEKNVKNERPCAERQYWVVDSPWSIRAFIGYC
jgi:hypothetical protein